MDVQAVTRFAPPVAPHHHVDRTRRARRETPTVPRHAVTSKPLRDHANTAAIQRPSLLSPPCPTAYVAR